MFERVVETCIAAGLVGGEGFAVDASLIQADANKQRSIAGQPEVWAPCARRLPATINREMAPTREIMRKLITTIALLALIDTSAAMVAAGWFAAGQDWRRIAIRKV